MNLAALEKHELIQYCAELEKKNEALETSNRNSKTWLSLLSHDLKGLFANLVWLDNLYESGSMSLENLAELIPELKANAQRSQRALNDTFLSVRIQHEKILDREDQINVKETFHAIEQYLAQEIKDKDLQIMYSGDPEITIRSNKLMVKSILTKILDNAVKFSLKGNKIQINVKLLNDSKCQIGVQDFGTGVHTYNLDKLFTWDVTAIPGTAGEKGAGLGLILAKEALTLLDGSIQIVSKDGEGTLVEITL